MKYVLVLLILLAFQDQLSAQVSDQGTRTKLEEFQDRNSSLILKEYIDVAETRTLSIQVIKMTLLPDKKSAISGVLISWGTTSIGVFQQAGQAFVDADEIDTVVKGLETMLTMVGGPIPANYTELELSTRTGLKLTSFPSKTAWNIALERQGHRQYIFSDDLAKIKDSLTKAKSQL